jgi:hypothetical protein
MDSASTSSASSANEQSSAGDEAPQLNQTILSQPSTYKTISNYAPSPQQTYAPKSSKNINDFDYSNANDRNKSKRSTPSFSSNNNNAQNIKQRYNKSKEEARIFYQTLLKTITDSINIIKAVTMRLIFSLHSLIAISYVYIVKRDEWYAILKNIFLLLSIPFLLHPVKIFDEA